MISIRGATTIQNNTSEDIIKSTSELLLEIIKRNELDTNKIITIFFSCTKDITADYPAKAARKMGLTHVSLMCLQEMHVEGSLPKCIRICLLYNAPIPPSAVKYVYLNEAVNLRPDLIQNDL